MKTRILVVAPYPIKTPMHGGQKRTQALVRRYRELSSNVTFIAVYLADSYKDGYKSDIAITNQKIQKQLKQHRELTDILAGTALIQDDTAKLKFSALLKRIKPQVVHIEQPYMVEPVSDILKELNLKSLIIFGSQNVESEMKRGIYKLQLSNEDLRALVKRTEEVERMAVKRADIILAVSGYDLLTLRSWNKFTPGYVVSNGIESPLKYTPKINQWSLFKKDDNIQQIATFIGSAHPPNYFGFRELVSGIKLVPAARIVVAGGVSEVIRSNYKTDDTIWDTVFAAGVLPSASLHSLIHESDIILLPILNGGGSNLKTAEAIISHKKIVATQYAFRGYEKYLSLPNIYLANSPKAFERALDAAIKSDYIPLTRHQQKLADSVTWAHALINIRYVLIAACIIRIIRKLRV